MKRGHACESVISKSTLITHQVDKVGHLDAQYVRSLAQIRELKETHSLRRMYANVVLVNRDTQLFKRLLALLFKSIARFACARLL